MSTDHFLFSILLHVNQSSSLTDLRQRHNPWFEAIMANVHAETPKWDRALFNAQNTIVRTMEASLEPCYQIKANCHVRFVNMPAPIDPQYKMPFPNYMHVGQFREIKANVVRMSKTRLLEIKRDFVCNRCKQTIPLDADYELMYSFDVPAQCPTAGCNGALRQKDENLLPEYCVHYQDIKVQVRIRAN